MVELGAELLERGTVRASMMGDEADTAWAISDCLEPVYEALEASSLSPAERLMWLIDRRLEDSHDLLMSAEDNCDVWEADPEAWSQVADELLQRLDDHVPREEHSWSQDYERDRLSDWILTALEEAGREADMLTLALREAPQTGSYERAVLLLRRAGRETEARALAEEGLRNMSALPGYARRLKRLLREMAVEEGHELLPAAFAAQDFFNRPSLQGYCRLREAATEFGVWEAVRQPILAALETGISPTALPEWPLPDAEMPGCETVERIDPPECSLLTEIAVEEGDSARAMRWYRRLSEERPPGVLSHLSERVAEATALDFPDEAISIWDRLARAEINKTGRRNYENALNYLRPMQKLLASLDREDEWEAYLTGLREDHSRKRALQDVLDRLCRGPIMGD